MRNNYLWYQFFRYGIVRPALRMFYSDVSVDGTAHIPQNKPVIFVGNHQNALMDALHIVSNTNVFIHFLTRAEPFEMPFLSHFFRSLNMLPVYRVRDGFSTIKKNQQTFEQCYDRLANDDAVLVFAEANHDLKRRVRPLSKGFTRIAFGAEQKFDWELDIQIVPVGLNYGRHRKSRTPVHIQFGNAIPIAAYRTLYRDDKRQAAQQLTQATAAELKTLTMHVPKLNHYPLHHLLLDELEANRKDLINPGLVNRRVSVIEKQFGETQLTEAKALLDMASQHDIDLRDLTTADRFGWKDLLLSPVYLFALVNNAVPYQLIRWVTGHYLDDHVFDATAKFLLGLFLLPVYYLLTGAVLEFSGIGLPAVVGYFLLSVSTAPFFVRAKDLLFPNAAEGLNAKNSEIYESMKSKIKYFRELREELFDLSPEQE